MTVALTMPDEPLAGRSQHLPIPNTNHITTQSRHIHNRTPQPHGVSENNAWRAWGCVAGYTMPTGLCARLQWCGVVSDKTPCCAFRHIANRQTQITPPYYALNKVSFRHPSTPLQPGTCRLNGSMYPATQPHALRASVSPPPTPPRPTNLQSPISNLQTPI